MHIWVAKSDNLGDEYFTSKQKAIGFAWDHLTNMGDDKQAECFEYYGGLPTEAQLLYAGQSHHMDAYSVTRERVY